MWVVSTAVGGYRVPDYSEAGHSHIRSDVTDLNLGSLTAGSPLSISGSPKVIDGGASISFDDSDYLTISGSRLGAMSQAQDFGSFGIKADAISESTSGSGVTIDGLLIKDGGIPSLNLDDYLTTDGSRAGATGQAQDFGSYGVKADVIDESTADAGVTIDGLLIKDGTIPSLGFDGSGYLKTDGSRAGATGQAQDFGSYGIKADIINESTVDTGVTIDGFTIKDGGFAIGADLNFNAYKAIAMACDNGTSFPSSPALGQWFYLTTANCLFFYDGTKWKPIISFGNMTLYVDGANGSDAIGKGFASGSNATATIQYAVNLIPPVVGGDVTVNIAAGTYAENLQFDPRAFAGNYSINLVGELVSQATGTATSYKNSGNVTGTGKVNTVSGGSTTVTLSGGGSTSDFWVGAIIKANNTSRVVTSISSSTTFTVDSAVDWYNGGAGYSWSLWQSQIEDSSASWSDDQHNDRLICTNTSDFDNNLLFVLDTVAATKRIWLAGIMNSAPGSYAIYSPGVEIQGMATIRNARVTFKYLKLNGASQNYAIQAIASPYLTVYGCWITGATSYGINVILSYAVINGAHVTSTQGILPTSASHLVINRSLIKTNSYNLLSYNRSASSLNNSYVIGNSSSASLLASVGSFIFFSSSVVTRASGATLGSYANTLSGLVNCIANLFAPGYTTPYGSDASTYSFVN
jgi:hypothetical protein